MSALAVTFSQFQLVTEPDSSSYVVGYMTVNGVNKEIRIPYANVEAIATAVQQAQNAATLATNKAAAADTSATSASTSATNAATSASSAAASDASAAGHEAGAAAAQVAAEAARDSLNTTGKVFTATELADGTAIANTTSGQQFSALSADLKSYGIYRNNAGTALAIGPGGYTKTYFDGMISQSRPYYALYKQISNAEIDAAGRVISAAFADGSARQWGTSIRASNGLVSVDGELSFGTTEGVSPVAGDAVDGRRPYYAMYKQIMLGLSDNGGRLLNCTFIDSTTFGIGGGGSSNYDPYAAGLLPAKDLFVSGDSMATDAFRVAIADVFGGTRASARVNRGGFTTDAISAVLGVMPITLTSGVTIPASGGVVVTLSTNPLYSGGAAMSGATARMTIAGIEGILSTDTATPPVLTFTRSTSGSSTVVASGTAAVLAPTNGTSAVPGTELYRKRTVILRGDRNNAIGTVAQRIASRDAVMRLIEYQTSLERRVLWWGRYLGRAYQLDGTTLAEGMGTAAYDAHQAYMQMMTRDLPGIYMERQTWACKEAIYELGMTPTSDDLADMALGCIPRSLFQTTDLVHVNTTMQTLEGTVCGKLLKSKGF